ncbi:MAG: hypothetical protein HC859_06410 [Bacteroidia bacterium]|nr:hypothetical protein [Bacteroidia bacterium]
MDDQQFDERIKSAIEGYEATGFDTEAHSAFRRRYDSMPSVPWYRRYRTEMVLLAGMAACTFVVIWYMHRIAPSSEADGIALLTEENRQLRTQLDRMTALPGNAPPARRDTVVVVQMVNTPSDDYLLLRSRIAHLEQMLSAQAPVSEAVEEQSDVGAQLPETAAYRRRLALHAVAKAGARASALQYNDNKPDMHVRKLSAPVIRALERHYHTGVGVHVAPTAEVSRAFYKQAQGAFNGSVGVAADLILSPSLSLETGIKYLRRYYEVEDMHAARLPGVDESLGSFDVAEIDTWGLEIPLNLKYRYPLDVRTHLLVGAGYSANVYFKQVFEYDYRIPQNNGFTVASTYANRKPQVYPGTANALVGFNHSLKNGRIFEASLFYQYGLGQSGLENVTPRYLGLRAAYWFRLR